MGARAVLCAAVCLLLACCVHSEQQVTSGRSAPWTSGANTASAEQWWSSCEALRFHLGAFGEEVGSAEQQTWGDIEHEGVAQCRITFTKAPGSLPQLALVSYTISKDLLRDLVGAVRQHAMHRAAARPATMDARQLVTKLLGLPALEMDALAAAVGLVFPRLTSLFTWSVGSLLLPDRPADQARASAAVLPAHCFTHRCAWEALLSAASTASHPGISRLSLEDLLAASTLVRDSGIKTTAAFVEASTWRQPAHVHAQDKQHQEQPRAAELQEQGGECCPNSEEEASQSCLSGGDPLHGASGVAAADATADSCPSSASSPSQSSSFRQQQRLTQAQSPRQLHPFFDQLLDHMHLFAELVGSIRWRDLLFWVAWLLAPSQIVAFNAIQALGPTMPALALYVVSVSTLHTRMEWRTAFNFLSCVLLSSDSDTLLVRRCLASFSVLRSILPASLCTTLLCILGIGLTPSPTVKWLLLGLLFLQQVVFLLVARRFWDSFERRYQHAQQRAQLRQLQGGGARSMQLAAAHSWRPPRPPPHALRGARDSPLPPLPLPPGAAAAAAAPGRRLPAALAAGGSAAAAAVASEAAVHWPPPLDFPAWLEDEPDLPEAFRCPITLGLMREPTSASSGLTYERKAIVQWLQMHRIDPVCQVPLKRHRLTPNLNLRHMVEVWAKTKLTDRQQQQQQQQHLVSTQQAAADVDAAVPAGAQGGGSGSTPTKRG